MTNLLWGMALSSTGDHITISADVLVAWMEENSDEETLNKLNTEIKKFEEIVGF